MTGSLMWGGVVTGEGLGGEEVRCVVDDDVGGFAGGVVVGLEEVLEEEEELAVALGLRWFLPMMK